MATIVITPTEFTVGNDVIINGIIDDGQKDAIAPHRQTAL
jgi:hypothetical protein